MPAINRDSPLRSDAIINWREGGKLQWFSKNPVSNQSENHCCLKEEKGIESGSVLHFTDEIKIA